MDRAKNSFKTECRRVPLDSRLVSDYDPTVLTGEPVSYSYRARPETNAEIWRKRISVTTGLFVTDLASAGVLGRKS